MSRLDFIVNSRLYDFGLIFSYEWANSYWLAYDLAFVVFSVMIGYIYWFGSPKKACDLKVVVALLVTINLLAIGGLGDILYFVFWAGGLPTGDVVWWWSFWNGVFGTWNSVMQVELVLLMAGFSVLIWAVALYQKKKVCDYPI